MAKETVLIDIESIKDYSDKAYLVHIKEIDSLNKLYLPKSIVINYNKVTKKIQVEKWWYDRAVELNNAFKIKQKGQTE